MDVGLGRCPGTTSKSGGSCIEQQPDLRLRCGLEGLPALNELGVIALKRAEDRAECRLAATIAAVNQRVTTILTAADAHPLESPHILHRLHLPPNHAPNPMTTLHCRLYSQSFTTHPQFN